MLAQNKFYYNIIIVLHLIIFAFALIKGFLQNCRNMVAKSGEMLYITHVGHFPDVIRLERYRRGHNEPHSKCGRQETGARVRIPFSPPQAPNLNFNGSNRVLSLFSASFSAFGYLRSHKDCNSSFSNFTFVGYSGEML